MQPERSREWRILINNPQDSGFTHQIIKEVINTLPHVIYWCMADEISNKEHTYHTHLYICFENPIRFDTLKNKFPNALIEKTLLSPVQNAGAIWHHSQKILKQILNEKAVGKPTATKKRA